MHKQIIPHDQISGGLTIAAALFGNAGIVNIVEITVFNQDIFAVFPAGEETVKSNFFKQTDLFDVGKPERTADSKTDFPSLHGNQLLALIITWGEERCK